MAISMRVGTVRVWLHCIGKQDELSQTQKIVVPIVCIYPDGKNFWLQKYLKKCTSCSLFGEYASKKDKIAVFWGKILIEGVKKALALPRILLNFVKF
jgi:hypothetical protein